MIAAGKSFHAFGLRAALAAFFLTTCWQAQAQERVPAAPATITVTGQGEAELKPEIARIIVTVVSSDETVPAATAANRETSEKVIAKIQAFGIAPDDLKTQNFQVSRARLDSTGKAIFSGSSGNLKNGFQAEHRLEITLRSVDTVGKVVGDLMTVDNLTLQQVDWDVNKPGIGDDKARADAIRDARHRTEIYATAANMKLGRLLTISDELRTRGPVAYGDGIALAAHSGGASAPIIPPATLTFNASARMIWEILPQ